MLRTHNCNSLNIDNVGETVTLCGWVQKTRDLGGMTFVDLRDRYGITQLAFDIKKNKLSCLEARSLNREFVIQAKGLVIERESKNNKIFTGAIEIEVSDLTILNRSKIPPFTIEDNTDGGEELRMKYRYLDIRRKPIKDKLILRAKVSSETRKYLDKHGFIEVETPYLIKSTPEGARDFVVPSRMNEGHFYALPQSPQTFKQLLMVSGIDKYYQIVKCFRDEDLRSDRQPEFTQIDCEMSFVNQEEILNTFEGLTQHLLQTVKAIKPSKFARLSYQDSIKKYGTDKPDLRFGMEIVEITQLCQKKDFSVFNESELVAGINVQGCANYSRKQLDKLIEFVKTPQIGASGLIYCKFNEDNTTKSSVDKFFNEQDKKEWKKTANCKNGDLLIIMAGEKTKTQRALGALRLHLANELNLRDPKKFAPVWIVDFPLLEWDEESKRYHAMHHPFTAPKNEDLVLLDKEPGKVRANAYDLVLNGNEIGGGSIRIHDKELQQLMFKHLGFSENESREQFGFLMDAFEYGAPPHGGIAFGFDRLCAIIGGQENIRDFIAFPKNNSGRDTMINSPSLLSQEQLNELSLDLKINKKSQ